MHDVEIWKNGKLVGTAAFSDEEANHFRAAPVCAASVALNDSELIRMNLDSDDEITVCVN